MRRRLHSAATRRLAFGPHRLRVERLEGRCLLAGVSVTPTAGLTTTEAGGTAAFDIVLTSLPLLPVTINLHSSDTTEGTVSTSSLVFGLLDWFVPQTVTITGVDDFEDDGDIGYWIVLDPAISLDIFYSGLDPSDVSVSNTDDDTAGIIVAPTSGLTTTEAGGTATFDVALTSKPTADVTIGLSSSNTAEGTLSTSSLTFTTTNWNIAQSVTTTGVDDFEDDGDVGYSIIPAAAISGDANYNGINPTDVGVTNTDDDTAGITVTPTSGLTTTEAGGTTSFDVVLTSKPTADVTIGLASSNTDEGTLSTGSLTFTAANWNVAQTVTITGVDDFEDDGNISYAIVTAPAASSDTHYSGLNAADVSVSNTDDDTAGITVTPTSGLVTTEAGGTTTLDVVLTSKPTADVTIGLASSNTAEGTLSTGSLTFTAANWNVAQTVTITGVDDFEDDDDIGYSILTAAAVSSDANYDGLDPADVSVTNTDDDTAGISVTPTSELTTTEAGGTVTFDVALTSKPTADVTIGLSSSNAAEGTLSSSSLTFTTTNWNIAQSVTITGVDDFVDDGNISYAIVTAPAASSDPLYDGLNAADVSVSNTDDDTAGITVTPISALVTTEAGGTAAFLVVLTSQPLANVTTGLSSSSTAEGILSTGSLTFTSANWNVAQTVIVTGAADAVIDGDQQFHVVFSAAASVDANYEGLRPSDLAILNLDDETFPFLPQWQGPPPSFPSGSHGPAGVQASLAWNSGFPVGRGDLESSQQDAIPNDDLDSWSRVARNDAPAQTAEGAESAEQSEPEITIRLWHAADPRFVATTGHPPARGNSPPVSQGGRSNGEAVPVAQQPSEQALADNGDALPTSAEAFESAVLTHELDLLWQEFAADPQILRIDRRLATNVAIAATVGGVAWSLQARHLLGMGLTTVGLWGDFDPRAILRAWRAQRNDSSDGDDKKTLQSLVKSLGSDVP